MNTVQLDLNNPLRTPLRSKRRPALACQECRRRKIRCDRQTPCGPCSRASTESCNYVYDTRRTLNTAPFEAHDTSFTVFEQAPRWQPPNLANSPDLVPAPSTTAATSTSPIESSPDLQAIFSDFPTTSFDSADSSHFPQLSSPQPESYQAVAQTRQLQPQTIMLPASNPDTRGVFYKGRFYGRSHWLNFAHPSSEVTAVIATHETKEHGLAAPTLARCKAMIEAKETLDLTLAHLNGSLADLMPLRTPCDALMRAYLRTLQTTFGIVDVPSFLPAYANMWSDPTSVEDSFRATLLLVIAIGSACVSQEASMNRVTILQWVTAASRWYQSCHVQMGLSLDALVIQCLYLAACSVHSIKTDHPWAEANGIMHRAMKLGLHIDPKKHPTSGQLPLAQIQYHRKLWAAIVELVLQDCMDTGTPPSITPSSYNCEPPRNIDDVEVDQYNPNNDNGNSPSPSDRLTSSSFPILLMQMAPVRMRIAAYVNHFNSDMTYKDVLRLHTEFSTTHKRCTLEIKHYGTTNSFQTKMFDLLVQRFVLALHHPFAARATTNPEFYFSRKMCFEAALTLFSPNACFETDALYALRLSGNGYLLDVNMQATLYMCHQLLCDWNSHSASAGTVGHEFANLVRSEMLRAINTYVRLLRSRVALGRRSSAARFVNVSCLLAQASSTHTAENERQKIEEVLEMSLKECQGLLSALLDQGGDGNGNKGYDGNGNGEREGQDLGWPTGWDESFMMDLFARSDASAFPLSESL